MRLTSTAAHRSAVRAVAIRRWIKNRPRPVARAVYFLLWKERTSTTNVANEIISVNVWYTSMASPPLRPGTACPLSVTVECHHPCSALFRCTFSIISHKCSYKKANIENKLRVLASGSRSFFCITSSRGIRPAAARQSEQSKWTTYFGRRIWTQAPIQAHPSNDSPTPRNTCTLKLHP